MDKQTQMQLTHEDNTYIYKRILQPVIEVYAYFGKETGSAVN